MPDNQRIIDGRVCEETVSEYLFPQGGQSPGNMQVDSQLEELLRAEIGDHLRSIVSYEAQELQFHFLRNDIQNKYDRNEFYDIFDDLILEGMARGYLESRFDAGKLQTAVYEFEEAIIFHFTADELSGVVVSVDRDTHSDFESFVSKIKDAIST